MDKTILHCDCNSFYTSVETVNHPEYACVPMAVCGSVEDRHGIVLAKNELAKKCNIITGEAVWSAKAKCPSLITVEPNHKTYEQYSILLNKIYEQYTDRVEPFGIDESWLDVSESRTLFGSGVKIADELRLLIKKEIGITISVGVSFNKSFSKLGSDYKKPDATTYIPREHFKEIIFPLPASDLIFVGKKTGERLKMMGINTIGQLAACEVSTLVSVFGKFGESIHIAANGNENSVVSLFHERTKEKSIGNGMTFKRDLVSKDDAKTALDIICDEVGTRMRAAKMKSQTIVVGIRDTKLSVITKQKQLKSPTFSSKAIEEAAFDILSLNWDFRKPIRSLTVTCNNLIDENLACEQLYIYGSNEDEKQKKVDALEKTIDNLRKKFGADSIFPCSVLNSRDEF